MMTPREHLLGRPLYQKRLLDQVGTEPIKVITGVRRCGKSALLELLVQDLGAQGVSPSSIFYKNLDEFGVPFGYSVDDLTSEISKAREDGSGDTPFFVLLDEVQELDGWEHVVRGFQGLRGIDVFVTGSNARLLSSELSTLLSGRSIELPVFPLSFSEYVSFKAASPNSGLSVPPSQDDLFASYVHLGGMPGMFGLANQSQEEVSRMLASIYDSVVIKDVARRFQVRDISLLDSLVRYAFSTSGNLFSARSVVNALSSAGVHTSVETVNGYLDALEQAFVLSTVNQTGLRGKSMLRPLRKIYPVDTGLRNLVTGFSGTDLGLQLENVVFMELKRRGFTVSVGSGPSCEVDFVATRGSNRLYVQVTASMLEESTRQRELEALRGLGNSFQKIVLTADRLSSETTQDGICVLNLQDWLMAEE